MFDFQGPGFKVKVSVDIFRKNFVIVLVPYLLMDFNITSHTNVRYDSISSKFKFQDARFWLFLEKLSNSGCYFKNFVITPALTFTNRFVGGDLYSLRYLV